MLQKSPLFRFARIKRIVFIYLHLMPFPAFLLPLILLACHREPEEPADQAHFPESLCVHCDNSPLTVPVMDSSGGYGSVTTYGSVTHPQASSGGACNYGSTKILNYAAIHVHLEPGDHRGPWQGGRICGQCTRVRIGSSRGWRTAVVRIVDKCPDAYCGIDLGGYPAAILMDSIPGRYAGAWEWISCDGLPGVSDGPAVLYVKDGANPWWSLIQVRNPPERVKAIQWQCGARSGTLQWATEAENFFSVPSEILADTNSCLFTVQYPSAPPQHIRLLGFELSHASASYRLSSDF